MQATAEHYFRLMLLNPASPLELMLAAGLAAFVFVLVLNKVGAAFNLALAQTGRSLIVLVVGHAVVLGGLAMLATHVKLPALAIPVAAVILMLAVVTPLTCLLLKGSYLSALMALLISMAAAFVMTLFVHTTFAALGKSGDSVGHGRQHRRDLERVMETP